MTRDLRRLQNIEALFATRERSAGSELASYEKAASDARAQLEVLRNYRRSYLNGDQRQPGMTANHYQNHASFMRRLNDAIEQQEEALQRVQIDCDAMRQRYRLCRQRTLAVGKAHGKRLAVHRADLERQEQKELEQWRPRRRDPDR